jgi:hypothetical protein
MALNTITHIRRKSAFGKTQVCIIPTIKKKKKSNKKEKGGKRI